MHSSGNAPRQGLLLVLFYLRRRVMAKNHNPATQSWTTLGKEELNWLSSLPVSIRVKPAAKPSWEAARIGLITAVLGASLGLSSPADAAMPPEQGSANA